MHAYSTDCESAATAPARGIRVCVVLESHYLAAMGGAEYQAHLLCEALAARDDVSLIYLARHVPDDDRRVNLPYELRCVGSAAGLRRRAVLFDAPGLWKALCDLRPDVIYQRMKQSYTGICGWYARKAGIPLVFHAAHDLDLRAGWVRRLRWGNLPLDLAEEALGNFGVRAASHVVVQSRRQRESLRRNFGIDAAAVVPNFQPLPETLPEKPGDKVRVLWVANFKYAKRPELFLRLAGRFAGRGDVHFLMVGRASDHRSLRDLPQRLQRLPNLDYLGPLPLERVEALMAQADIFVNTSRDEGFPNTFIQAWARGAVVTSLTVDIDDGLQALGIGYCAGDFENLVKIVDHLSRSPEKRREIARRAFAYVHANHSLQGTAHLADLIVAAAQARARPLPAPST